MQNITTAVHGEANAPESSPAPAFALNCLMFLMLRGVRLRLLARNRHPGPERHPPAVPEPESL